MNMVTKNSGYLIQSNYGTKGNFEVVINTREGLRHLFRDNDDPNLPWIKAPLIGSSLYSRPALIQSNYGTKGNFEVVVTDHDGTLDHLVRNNDDPNLPWHYVGKFASGASSAPALIQSNYGTKGNFEVVVNTRNGLQHWSRDNDDPTRPWHLAGNFASEATGGPALIQSNFGQKGNFEVITDGHHIFRNNDDPNLPWVWGKHFETINGYAGAALIQSNFGQKGNFEAIVQVKALQPEPDPPPPYNNLTHHFRDNDDPNLPWIRAPTLPVVTPA